MNFASDNWAGASERVIAALVEAARRGGPAYGGDPLTAAVTKRFSEIFERDVAVFFVATGTAANALALGHYGRPGSVAFCHRQAHVLVDEPGSTELFGSGMRLIGLDGVAGKIEPTTLGEALGRFCEGNVHHGQPAAVSLTELTELGATYQPDEVAAIVEVARGRRMAVHMDGARFAGAVAALGCAPADLTWRAGVDVLSFGGTKNGCIAAEAVVFFDPSAAVGFALARQRAGHAFSKNWFVAAQFAAYLADGHWLDLARHANAMAARLAAVLKILPAVRLAVEPAANEVFAVVPRALRPPVSRQPACSFTNGRSRRWHKPIGRATTRRWSVWSRAFRRRTRTWNACCSGSRLKNKGRPVGRPSLRTRSPRSGGDLVSICLALRVAVADRDRARLHRLGDLAHEIDVQEAVLEARALHLDMVGELEAALESARRRCRDRGTRLLFPASRPSSRP